MRSLVMKFGGTSVGSPEAMDRAATLVARYRETWPELVVVTSALSGVTDALLRAAREAVAGHIEVVGEIRKRLEARHRAVVEALLPQGTPGWPRPWPCWEKPPRGGWMPLPLWANA